MANSEVNKSHQTILVVDENKYDIHIQLANNSLIVTAEDQITKIQYKTIRSGTDIFNLTEKASYNMSMTRFYYMMIAGFEKRYSVTVNGQIAGSVMILSFHWAMKFGFMEDEKVFDLTMDKVEQTDIEMMTKMLRGFVKMFSTDVLDKIVASNKTHNNQIIELQDICYRLTQSLNNNDRKLRDNDQRLKTCLGSIFNLKNDYDNLKQDVKKLDIELSHIKASLIKKECIDILDDKIITMSERLTKVENDSIYELKEDYNNLKESLVACNRKTQNVDDELYHTNTQLKTIENATYDLKLALEENMNKIVALTNCSRMAGFWSGDDYREDKDGIKIKFTENKKDPNSSLIITGFLNIIGASRVQQICTYGDKKYYGMVQQTSMSSMEILSCNFVLKDNPFVGIQSLELSFAFANNSIKIINPINDHNMSATQSFIQVTEVII